MPTTMLELHGLLTKAVNSIAVDTQQVTIGFKSEPCLCFCVRVAPNDLGRVIGTQGNTIRALRTVVHAVGQQMGVDVRICVGEVGTA
jgi:predicted RNA-binding protein YlqC (UPF0109 family)